MPISSFLDSQWLLYTQPVMSEENTAHMDGDLRYCLKRVKIVKMGCFERYSTTSPFYRAYNYPRSDTLS